MFLSKGNEICFICGQPIAGRVAAAQLQYASPEDVGDDARHGRDWVHRACWAGWPRRAPWARSSVRLMSSQANMRIVRGVAAMPMRDGVLITDTEAAFSLAVPRSASEDLRSAFEGQESTSVQFDHATWVLSPAESGMRLTGTHNGALFEELVLEDPAAWRQLLRDIGEIDFPRSRP